MGERQVKLAILDRDGTIVEGVPAADGHLSSAFSPDRLRFLPHAIDGLRALAAAGYTLAIATNQPGPAKGQATRADVERTNAALVAMLAEAGVAIARVEVCMHHPLGGPGGDPALVGPCECRKPRPGMILALLARFGADPATTWMIGDSLVDLDAGAAAGVHTARVGGDVTLVEVAARILQHAD
jgi:D-glycero-D-manno-heptose 1,7-bisphosphate phosphatase